MQTKPKISKGKKMIKTKAEINEVEKQQRKINGNKNFLFEKINKIEKLLSYLLLEKERGLSY